MSHTLALSHRPPWPARVNAAVATSCDSAGIGSCASSVASCYGKNPTNHCVCYADEVSCLEGLGCGPNILSGVVKACEGTGCSVSACGGPITNNCNSTAVRCRVARFCR